MSVLCSALSGALRHRIPRVANRMPVAFMFHEADRKGGYNTKIKLPLKEHIKHGWKDLQTETGKFAEEWKSKLRSDLYHGYLFHGDYEKVYEFNTHEAVENWVTTCDSDHSEGKSKAEFVFGPKKTGVFRGMINVETPKDGIIKNAGYAAIRGPRAVKSFHRSDPFDWTAYTHLVVRCRGDGRSYQIVLGMDRFFDVNWNDTYTYALFTRGGPYWQVAKIPFSKFYLAAKGRIQDKQERIQLTKVSYVGITLGDNYNGPFSLEVDWIGVMYDENHHEEFAYEMYNTSMTALH